MGPDTYIVADYTKPGGGVELDRVGRASGSTTSPAGTEGVTTRTVTEVLPSRVICVNDLSGTAQGPLNTKGFDLLPPDGTLPTQLWTR